MALFGLDTPDRQRAFLFGLLLLGAGYVFYQYVWGPVHAERVVLEETIAALEQKNTQARALTQPGRIEELRRREAEYEVALAAYETMLPTRSEVADLLEEIARSALMESVDIVNFAPLAPVEGSELVQIPYDLQVQGSFHEIGRFLASIANMPRLVRPVVVSLEHVAIETGAEAPPDHEVLASLTVSTFLPSDDRLDGMSLTAGELGDGEPRASARAEGENDAG